MPSPAAQADGSADTGSTDVYHSLALTEPGADSHTDAEHDDHPDGDTDPAA